ncbi:c-type cytochrome [Helicobacter turcicus]|uniref:Cytochrome c n=1 Tax=Helicobacter turcicus TaxID=2867412 RepID=A0ABS7JPG3_9HELI|nr:c-type cytochrome [Helicobacter turcicus]MBX7491296.1 cytochrome c [Helicobacter turcicus]MBX7546217.1 cytochrome c [Helicobacter turcicus]
MRFVVVFVCIVMFLKAEESFIAPLEYGKMLYENPRGIGCVECHGQYGQGDKIADYTHKNQAKSIHAPRINNLDFNTFKNALQSGKRVMPKYYLTASEIEAIYKYIRNFK